MTTPTAPTVDLDTDTRAEIQPPCEIVVAVVCPTHGAHRNECDQDAQFIARLQCGCEQPYIALLCTHHTQQLPALRILMVHAPCRQGVRRIIGIEALR